MKKIPTLFEREYEDHKVVGIKPVLRNCTETKSTKMKRKGRAQTSTEWLWIGTEARCRAREWHRNAPRGNGMETHREGGERRRNASMATLRKSKERRRVDAKCVERLRRGKERMSLEQ